MLVEIRRMTKEYIPGAIECVQTGFADDPYFNWVFDVSKVRTVCELARDVSVVVEISK